MNEQKPAGEVQNNQKKPFYKRWWFIIIAVVVFFMIVSSFGEDKNEKENKEEKAQQTENVGTELKAENNQAAVQKISQEDPKKINEESAGPNSASNISEYKKVMSRVIVLATEGINYTQNASVYGASDNYKDALSEIEKARVSYSTVVAEINKLSTPDKYKKTQELTVDAVDKFNQANNFLKNGLNKNDVGSVNRAVELMEQGTEIIVQARQELINANKN